MQIKMEKKIKIAGISKLFHVSKINTFKTKNKIYIKNYKNLNKNSIKIKIRSGAAKETWHKEIKNIMIESTNFEGNSFTAVLIIVKAVITEVTVVVTYQLTISNGSGLSGNGSCPQIECPEDDI